MLLQFNDDISDITLSLFGDNDDDDDDDDDDDRLPILSYDD